MKVVSNHLASLNYRTNLEYILSQGTKDENPRPRYADGTPAHSLFISQVYEEYNIGNNQFPIPCQRPTAVRMGINEMLWIYQKQSHRLEDAHALGITWWDSWDIGDGTIGKRYGYTVATYNLMNNLLAGLVKDPFGRRHIISLWQEEDLTYIGLNPCAYETIWTCRKVEGRVYLDMTLIQRSNDYLVAGYINKIQYVALQMMVAGHCGYVVGKFAHFVQNLHIYDRHIEAAKEVIATPLGASYQYIELKTQKNFYDYSLEDFEIVLAKIPKLNSPLELAI